MVVSWVSHVLPAGGVIIRCVESCACRQLGTPDGAIGAGWTTAGDKSPRYNPVSPPLWIPAPYRGTGQAFAGMTNRGAGMTRDAANDQ